MNQYLDMLRGKKTTSAVKPTEPPTVQVTEQVVVTGKKRGRPPKKGGAMTPAEKQRAYRARKKQAG